MGIIIENPGILTTVQDEGRFGSQQFGVSRQGRWIHSPFILQTFLWGTVWVKAPLR